MKTKNQVLDEMGLDENSTLEELLEKLSLVTVSETNGIKSISVKPLPNVVKDKSEELKNRFINTTIDENNGMASILNKRIAILNTILSNFGVDIDTLETDVDAVNTSLETFKDNFAILVLNGWFNEYESGYGSYMQLTAEQTALLTSKRIAIVVCNNGTNDYKTYVLIDGVTKGIKEIEFIKPGTGGEVGFNTSDDGKTQFEYYWICLDTTLNRLRLYKRGNTTFYNTNQTQYRIDLAKNNLQSQINGIKNGTIINSFSATESALALKLNISDIVDAFNSTSTTKPLSANKGKVLKDYIDEINALKVSSWSILPNNNNYPSEKLVKDTLDTNAANMTTYVDLKASVEKAYADSLNTAMNTRVSAIENILSTDITAFDTLAEIATYLQEHTSEYTELVADVQANTNAITDLESEETGIAAAEAVRVTNENTRISNENARISAENQRISNENARITAETARQSGYAQMDGRLDALESAVDVINNTSLPSKQNLIDSTHKLSSDLVTDTNATNKFVLQADMDYWNLKQDPLDETDSTALSGGGVVVKDSYVESFFATDQEIADMLEEVLSNAR